MMRPKKNKKSEPAANWLWVRICFWAMARRAAGARGKICEAKPCGEEEERLQRYEKSPVESPGFLIVEIVNV